jgi:SAM-dependent methyltransferase
VSDRDLPSGAADFSPGEDIWRAHLGLARDVVRQRLVLRQLLTHLPRPTPSAPVRVLDVGCGQGTQSLGLARAGYQVIGVDPSVGLLADAAAALASEPPDVRGRASFRQGDLDHLTGFADDGSPDAADVVCCHGVLMYLASPVDALGRLIDAVRPGGIVSVLTRNRAGLAMRAGMRGDWAGALEQFDARYYTNSLGVERARADEPGEIMDHLVAHGADIVEWYGVRLFSDHWADVTEPADIDDLVRAEEEAGRRDPYRSLCATTHVIARRA